MKRALERVQFYFIKKLNCGSNLERREDGAAPPASGAVASASGGAAGASRPWAVPSAARLAFTVFAAVGSPARDPPA